MRWSGQYLNLDVGQTDLSLVIKNFAPDMVIHAAGPASVGGSFRTPLDDFRGSVAAWVNLLDSVRRSEQSPVILFPSSAAVYGNATRLPISEDDPTAPISPYGFHKVACEGLAKEYADCFGLNIVICRLFSVFGEDQRRLLVWDLYERLTGPEPIVWLEGTGEEARDYLHVDEIASAVLKMGADLANLSTHGILRVFNVASGQQLTVRDLALHLGALLGISKPIRCHGRMRIGDPLRWHADISRLRALIPAWCPRPFLQSLQTCVNTWLAETERTCCDR
jgi:UDP-glucose 4-epimerase